MLARPIMTVVFFKRYTCSAEFKPKLQKLNEVGAAAEMKRHIEEELNEYPEEKEKEETVNSTTKRRRCNQLVDEDSPTNVNVNDEYEKPVGCIVQYNGNDFQNNVDQRSIHMDISADLFSSNDRRVILHIMAIVDTCRCLGVGKNEHGVDEINVRAAFESAIQKMIVKLKLGDVRKKGECMSTITVDSYSFLKRVEKEVGRFSKSCTVNGAKPSPLVDYYKRGCSFNLVFKKGVSALHIETITVSSSNNLFLSTFFARNNVLGLQYLA